MPRALEDCGSLAACDDDPGKAMRAITEKLAARGFGVRSPDWEGDNGVTRHGRRNYVMSGRASIPAAQRSRCDRARPAGGGAGTVGWAAAPGIRGPAQSLAPVPVLPSHPQGTTMTGEWPRRDAIEFGPLPGAVPCARLHTRLLLVEWGLAGLSERAELVVSELVTNAVAASQQLPWISPVRLWLYADSTRVLIAVWDANPRLPVRADTDELAESGRGLLLVESLAAQWDAYSTPGYVGKVVRAICATDEPADH
jgi:anti-sigma regulatory factor (Ser/Thr protein kinase)